VQLPRRRGLRHLLGAVFRTRPSRTESHDEAQNAVDGDGTLIGGNDVAAQTQQVMKNLNIAPAAAGASVQDLVMMTILFVDGVDLAAAYPVAAAELAEAAPPVAAARVAGLAGCAPRGQRGRGCDLVSAGVAAGLPDRRVDLRLSSR